MDATDKYAPWYCGVLKEDAPIGSNIEHLVPSLGSIRKCGLVEEGVSLQMGYGISKAHSLTILRSRGI